MFQDLMQESFDKVIARMEENRKAEAEKKRVVDAVWEAYHGLGDLSVKATFDAMYDAGYLRLPANKD
jgi:hypothetical protein